MDIILANKIKNNQKLFDHLKEQSYWIKPLSRDQSFFKDFQNSMKAIYKERASDKVNNVIDGVEMLSSIIDTIK